MIELEDEIWTSNFGESSEKAISSSIAWTPNGERGDILIVCPTSYFVKIEFVLYPYTLFICELVRNVEFLDLFCSVV